jgi:homopolymeric O-antigen transport system permease protein
MRQWIKFEAPSTMASSLNSLTGEWAEGEVPDAKQRQTLLTAGSKASVKGTHRGAIRTAIYDLARALKAWRIWVLLGTKDITQRYRRSTLGQFWITVSIGVMVAGLGIIYSALFNQPIAKYVPYVAAGFVTWFLISGIITDGCTAFLDAGEYPKQLNLPLSAYILRQLFKNLLIFAHNLIIIPFVWLIFFVPVSWHCLLLLPGILLIALNGYWMILLLGTISARFRDLPLIVSTAMQVIFFITPIMFHLEQTPDNLRTLLNLSPFAALLAVARDPLLGLVPSAQDYALVVGMILLGWGITIPFFGKYRGRIAYWL